ncbi:MAG TPA: hypothetical protein VFZ00_15890, partial [Solirubrobacter sp.]|nr:hypothetical protein [Solirubrobacter sp.]
DAAPAPGAGGTSPAAATGGAAPPRAAATKPGPFPVIAMSLGLFLAIVAVLAFQMRAGADPALGKGEPVQVAAATPAPRKVLIRRVIVTRIVEHREGRRRPAPAAAAPPASTSNPAPAAPAPAPAPAPAAPPMTTRSS